MNAREVGGKVVHRSVIGLFSIFAAFPFAWMLITTFKKTNDLLDPNSFPFGYPKGMTLENLRVLFEETLFLRWMGNTLFVGLIVVLITLLLAVPAGYALARLSGSFGEQLGIGIFLTYLVPPTILFIPLAKVVSLLHLQDTLWSLVLTYPSFTIPFCTWLMMGFFKAIPKDIEEAAMVDGLSRLA
ncbi:MAG TPA: carbohydrate ABC transporter permease, partial [Myxococcales bacterium]|nr:carbohydrate ABC transporter permease [Myxococcales bacterium]